MTKSLCETGETISKKGTVLESDDKLPTRLPTRTLHTTELAEERTSSDVTIIKDNYTDGEQFCDNTAFQKAPSCVENCQGSVPTTTEQEGRREKIDSGEEQKSMIVDCGETICESRQASPGNKNHPTVSGNVDMQRSFKGASRTSSSNSDQGGLCPGEENILSENGKQFNSITNCL